MKLCILLAFFASQYEAITFDCLYSIEDWVVLDKIYGCTVKKMTIEVSDNVLVSVSKSHLKGKTSKDVQTINIENSTLTSLPKSIDKSFPNLKGIRVSKSRLTAIRSDDLKPFPQLRVLCLWANLLTALDGNLFVNNPNLEFVNFGSNQIRNVGPKFFSPLTKLVAAYFEDNACINNTNQYAIEDLKFELSVKCPPSFEMVEIALIEGGKLATKNDETDNKIQLLENRIMELEQQAKK